jgi:hypothetical protein
VAASSMAHAHNRKTGYASKAPQVRKLPQAAATIERRPKFYAV